MIYLDTSALAAIYFPEAVSERAETMVATQSPCAISDLSAIELFSAVSRRLRSKEISRRDANAIVDTFLADLKQEVFEVFRIESSHYRIARGAIARFDSALRTLDALHLSVVWDRGVHLLTCDRAFAHAARKVGVDVTLLRA